MPPKPTPSLESNDSFADVTFSDLSMEAADLSGKDFERCTFRRCKLPDSSWAKARLEDCVFEGCDLSQMLPEQLALRGVAFKDTRLWSVDWSVVGTFPSVEFERCDLRYSSFLKLRLSRTPFIDCRLTEANFIEVDLTEADFTGSNLLGSTVQGCVLTKTNFSKASGVLVDPQKNRVKSTRLGVEAAVALVQTLGFVVE
ncbi:pentapeptide repeat-containing protein [Sorangium sp. So ce131]|uniref:pentapeptide repeat-containing protein n=1 Tax=Sorangium sp. So ce131 TaxID=3133282 RepID=UPI003F63CB76